MTIGDLSQTPADHRPLLPRRKSGPWKQIAIVLASALVLGGSSCAGMAASYANHQTLFTVATMGFVIGLVTIPVTIIWAAVALIIQLFKKRGAQE